MVVIIDANENERAHWYYSKPHYFVMYNLTNWYAVLHLNLRFTLCNYVQ